jgi:hypothetical protein
VAVNKKIILVGVLSGAALQLISFIFMYYSHSGIPGFSPIGGLFYFFGSLPVIFIKTGVFKSYQQYPITIEHLVASISYFIYGSFAGAFSARISKSNSKFVVVFFGSLLATIVILWLIGFLIFWPTRFQS